MEVTDTPTLKLHVEMVFHRYQDKTPRTKSPLGQNHPEQSPLRQNPPSIFYILLTGNWDSNGNELCLNPPPALADLFLYSYESEFLDNIMSGHRKLARSFNLCYRYIDDLITFNNKKFEDYVKEIYHFQTNL